MHHPHTNADVARLRHAEAVRGARPDLLAEPRERIASPSLLLAAVARLAERLVPEGNASAPPRLGGPVTQG
jgi:hypothetical protein